MAYTIRDDKAAFFNAVQPWTIKSVEEYVRRARLVNGTFFNSYSFTLNNYTDLETEFENCFKELESLKDDEEKKDIFWLFCYYRCQQLIAFYGADKEGKDGYGKPNELFQHEKFAAKIKHYFDQCDVLTLDALPDQDRPEQWPLISDSAYIVVNGKLYYVVKGADKVIVRDTEVSPQKLRLFNARVTPQPEAKILSRKDLQYIRAQIDPENDSETVLKKMYKDAVGFIKMPTKVTAVKSNIGIINLWRVYWAFCRLTMTSGLNYFRDAHIIEKFEALIGKKFDEAAFIRKMEAPNIVFNALSVGLFAARLFLNAAELFRHVCLPHGGKTGLLKMENNPLDVTFDEVEKLLNGRDVVILCNNELYYADYKKRVVQQVEINNRNKKQFDQLKLKFSDEYKLADDKEQKLIVSVTGRKPKGAEKNSKWTERLSFEISKRNAGYLNDMAWTPVNLLTNYPDLINISAPVANWLVAGFLFFDFAVIIWQRYWAEKDYQRMHDNYVVELKDYEKQRIKVTEEIAQLRRQMDLLNDLQNSENYIAEANERMRQDIKEKLVAKEERHELLCEQIDSDIKAKLELDLKWKAKNSTLWFNAMAAALFATGFSAALIFASPVVAIVAYAACMVAVAMYLSGNEYGDRKIKALRLHEANRDYEEAIKTLKGPSLQPYIQCKNNALREYQAARREFWLTLARNVIIPTLMIALVAACWQAAVAFAILYVGYKLYQHYHKPSKAKELEEAPLEPVLATTVPASALESVEPNLDNYRVENQPDVGALVPAF